MTPETRTCSIDGCERPYKARGWCQLHYRRWLANGDPSSLQCVSSYGEAVCAVAECERPAYGRGYCTLHYQRFVKWGDPLLTYTPKRGLDVETRFLTYVDKSGVCWQWTGHIARTGYATFYDGRSHRAHVWAYTHWVGPIPEGLQLDHLCRNKSCVWPDHLEPVTQAENMHRIPGWGPAKTHCKWGHLYDEWNTLYVPGGRKCRTCRNEQARLRSRAKRARRAT